MEESISPFLTDKSRPFAKNLSLKSSILGAIFLSLAFAFKFHYPPLSNLLLIFSYFFAGTRALINTVEDLKNLEINIEVLMTLAAFLSILIGSAMEGALLLVLFSISGAMEETVTKKSKGAVTSLQELSPTFATLVDENGGTIERSVREVSVGDSLLIKAGEIVPLDGNVISGSSFVNLVHLTGESEPLSKQVGDEIQAGAQNLDGTLTIKVTRTSSDSTLMRIISLISEAQEAKPKVQRFLDKFSKTYATTIICLSFFFAIVMPFIFHIPFLGDEGSIYRALAFLIAASPCALIIATPTAYLSALSACAKRGILLKGGTTLDALAQSTSVAFDKTGTLTTGQLTCVEVIPLGQSSIDRKQALTAAASLEQYSSHPIGDAIRALAKKENIGLKEIQEFRNISGLGLEGKLDGKEIAIGNLPFLKEKCPNTSFESLSKSDKVLALLLIDGNIFVFEFEDELRAEVAETVDHLKQKLGMTPIMLTGDHKASADRVAKQVGIDSIYADLRPDDKLKTISSLSEKGHVAMVGDGINDAPALARATVGISMGNIGSGAAIEASDIVLLQDELTNLTYLVKKSRATARLVKENLTLALAVILLATTPALLGFIPLWLAVILHEGGTLLVGLNSLRLLR